MNGVTFCSHIFHQKITIFTHTFLTLCQICIKDQTALRSYALLMMSTRVLCCTRCLCRSFNYTLRLSCCVLMATNRHIVCFISRISIRGLHTLPLGGAFCKLTTFTLYACIERQGFFGIKLTSRSSEHIKPRGHHNVT